MGDPAAAAGPARKALSEAALACVRAAGLHATVPTRRLPWLSVRPRGEILLRAGLLAFFLWLTVRYWHPYYGFTRFLQIDASALAAATPALRDAPIYTYRDAGGYDGHYYGQIAADPTLRDPAEGGSMDNYFYRARRILGPALAHLLAAGNAVESVRIYAGLNLLFWFALAAVLWRLFPPGDWRAALAWTGILFTAGLLHAVRCALPDLPALLWLALGLGAVERGRFTLAGIWLGLAALTRETTLLATMVATGYVLRQQGWRPALKLALPAVLPAAAWFGYVRLQLGQDGGGWDNFTLPLIGWLEKWSEAVGAIGTEKHTLLAISTLLGLIALTVQAAYVLWVRQWNSVWWWTGLAYLGCLAFLNRGVWEGHPGAAPRVLLPLSLAFAVLAWRRRAGGGWWLGGSLGILGGILTLWFVPWESAELAAGRGRDGNFVVHIGAGFFSAEHHLAHVWSWGRTAGTLRIDCWPRESREVNATVQLSAITERPFEIRQAGRLLWTGLVPTQPQAVRLPGVQLDRGHAVLELSSPAPLVRESAASGRELGFAVHGLSLP